MSLVKKPNKRTPSAEDGADQIKQVLYQSVQHMEHSLVVVRKLVEQYGKSEILNALGEDAHELQIVYRKIKTTIEALDASREIPDID